MFIIEKTSEFDRWLRKLKDRKAKARILLRIQRMENGNFGDIKTVGTGISELRIHYATGYRVYFKKHGNGFILLLIGGDKKTQSKNIAIAETLWEIHQKKLNK